MIPHQRIEQTVRKAVNHAAIHGVEVQPQDAIADLERAAQIISANMESAEDDPAAVAKLGTSLAVVHTALSRIRLEAKKGEGPELDEDELAEQMKAWLRERGQL